MPSAWIPIRLISLPNSERASYSRKPVAFTIGSDSYAKVFGTRADFGLGTIQVPRGARDIRPCTYPSQDRHGMLRGTLLFHRQTAVGHLEFHPREKRHAEQVRAERFIRDDDRLNIVDADAADLEGREPYRRDRDDAIRRRGP